MQLSIGTLCINVIMKGQHCDPAIIKIVQEDFIETPWRNTIVDVLNDTERVSETGFIINVPSCRGIIGGLKLLRMDFVVGVKEFLENLRRHGNATQACEDAVEGAIFSSWRGTIGHECCHGSTVGPCTKAFKEQRVKSVQGENECVEVVSKCMGR